MKLGMGVLLLSAAGLACGCEAMITEWEIAMSEPAARAVINGRPLTPLEVNQLASLYGVQPLPGDYWYDSASGLFGVVGQPAAGFMYPGHDLGPVPPGASAGRTDVYFNGRELPYQEVAVVESILGYAPDPGRYWFDGMGNLGVEGSPRAAVNLYAAWEASVRQQQAGVGYTGYGGGGRGGGGDNFWTTRFSAGNSTADGSQGYVSVPGYGPVSYGM